MKRPRRPFLSLALVTFLALPAFAQQPDTLLQSIPAPPVGAQTGARLGTSVAVDGPLTVVGAPYDKVGQNDRGVVKVFDTATGALLHVIANPGLGIGFGDSLAISDTRVVVGDYSIGSAYVYNLSSATPTVPVTTLKSTVLHDSFGHSVAIYGTRVVVGAYRDDTGANETGCAYVFELSSATPAVPIVTLNNPTPGPGEYFGYAVAIFGTRVVVGAYNDDTGATGKGSVYVFDSSSATPTVPIVTLNNPSPTESYSIGSSVAISGTRVVVGIGAVRVYVYDLSSGTPTVPAATLNNPNPATNFMFGKSLAISGTRLVVGGGWDAALELLGMYNRGTTYVYDLSNSTPTVPVATLDNPSPSGDASNPGDTDLFGSSVAISGTRVVVGARLDDTRATDAGSAYVYDVSSTTATVPVATLNEPSPSTGDKFGNVVAVDGTLLVVGASQLADVGYPFAGCAFVYDLSSATPTVPVVTLKNPDPANVNFFGTSVDVSGMRVVVGGHRGGKAYVYDLGSSTPIVPTVVLDSSGLVMSARAAAIDGTRVAVGSDGGKEVRVYDLSSATPTVPVASLNWAASPPPGFGLSVDISGTRVVVGADQGKAGDYWAGNAYVYDLSSDTPTVPVFTLINPSPANGDRFGSAVAISGTRVVVGNHRDDTGGTDAGNAYVYELSSGTPTVPVATLNNPSPATEDFFGFSVEISGTRVVVGAYQDDTGATDAGRAYVYDLSSASPALPVATLSKSVPVNSDQFGISVAISGATTIIGTPQDDSQRLDKGAVYVFGPDTVTRSPVLVAPADGTRTGSPVQVSFNLPENALPGSVKLSFGESVLTLAATQAGAGSHSFSFNPATPTASPQIATATGPVVDGTYLVTLSYQDANGNPAASDTSSEVTIDTVTLPPVLLAPAANTTPALPVQVNYTLPEAPKTGTVKLAFGPHVLTMSALGETPGSEVAISFDPANPTSSPYIASGSPIPSGGYPVTLSYQDALGNAVAGTTHENVTISAVTSPPVSGPVIWSDDFSSGTLSRDYPGGKGGPDYVTGAGTYGSVSADGVIGVSAPSMRLDSGGGTSGSAGFAVTMDQFAPFTVGPLSATPFLRGSFDFRIERFSGGGYPAVYFYLTEGFEAGRLLTIGYTYYSLNDGDTSVYDLTLYAAPVAGGQPDSLAIGLVPSTGWLPGFDFGNGYSDPGGFHGKGTNQEFYRVTFLYNSITGTVTGRVTRLSTSESAPLPSGLSLTPGTTFSSDDVRDSFGVSATGMISTEIYVDNIVFEALSTDAITEPPVLAAPADGTRSGSPVQVSFYLRENALPGSVKLSFGETVLTLAATQEGAGLHSFSFDPANPTASPQIASATSPVADGSYLVTLSYQDAQGSPAASDTSSQVTIDTVTSPPVLLAPAANRTQKSTVRVNYALPETPETGTVRLAFGPNVLTISALGETPGGGSVAFSFDPASPTASPYVASGSPIPDGVYAVTLSYRDDAGKLVVSATNANVTIDTVSDPGNTVLFGEGSEVPASAGLPAEAVWRKFGVPAVNAAGDVVFTGEWADASGKGAAVFGPNSTTGELRIIIQRGAPVPVPGLGAEPPPPGAVVAKLRDPILADNGDVLTPVVLAGKGINAANDAALVWSPGSNPANARLVVREGQALAGGKVKTITAAEVGSAGVAFTATLVGKGITPANDSIACVWTPLGGVVPVVRQGQVIAELKLKHFNTLGTWAGAPGQGRGMASLDSAPLKLGFLGKLSDGRTALMASEPSGVLESFMITGDSEFAFKTLGLPAWANQLSSLIYLGTMQGGTKGIFQYNSDTNTRQAVAVFGSEYQIASDLVSFKSAKDLVVSSDGTRKGWVGAVKGQKVTSANDQVIAFADGPNLSIIAREGTGAPDASEGARWKGFQSLAMPARGPLFLGSLQRGPGRITSANDVGVWGMDSTGALHCLFREGDMIGGKKLKTHTVLKAVSGTPAVTRSWNDAGQVVWLATFTDGSTAIIKTQVP